MAAFLASLDSFLIFEVRRIELAGQSYLTIYDV